MLVVTSGGGSPWTMQMSMASWSSPECTIGRSKDISGWSAGNERRKVIREVVLLEGSPGICGLTHIKHVKLLD